MASVVTKLRRAKQMRCKTRKFQNTLRWLKKRAYRIDRRKSREALKQDKEYISIPRLTEWDII